MSEEFSPTIMFGDGHGWKFQNQIDFRDCLFDLRKAAIEFIFSNEECLEYMEMNLRKEGDFE